MPRFAIEAASATQTARLGCRAPRPPHPTFSQMRSARTCEQRHANCKRRQATSNSRTSSPRSGAAITAAEISGTTVRRSAGGAAPVAMFAASGAAVASSAAVRPSSCASRRAPACQRRTTTRLSGGPRLPGSSTTSTLHGGSAYEAVHVWHAYHARTQLSFCGQAENVVIAHCLLLDSPRASAPCEGGECEVVGSWHALCAEARLRCVRRAGNGIDAGCRASTSSRLREIESQGSMFT